MDTGTPETREYYNTIGWTRRVEGAQLEDFNRFGVKEDGPIRREM
jgi:hypothetical protein